MLHIQRKGGQGRAQRPIVQFTCLTVRLFGCFIYLTVRSLMPHHTTGGQRLTLRSDRRRAVRDRAYTCEGSRCITRPDDIGEALGEPGCRGSKHRAGSDDLSSNSR